MLKKDFNKLLKQEKPKKIIYMHCFSKITLTESQLDAVINLKNKKGEIKQ
jgi:hypothetical protein